MVVAARATRVSGAVAVVLLLLPPAGTAQNSKPHLRLGVGEAEEEEALAGPQVITAGVAAAAEQGRAAPAQTVSALSPTRLCSRQVTGWQRNFTPRFAARDGAVDLLGDHGSARAKHEVVGSKPITCSI